jgi:PTH1 family peptidyl-tRNA hydrolase
LKRNYTLIEVYNVKMIAGLGNPGLEYSVSRHNCGFMTIEQIAHELGAAREKKEKTAITRQAMLGAHKLLLVKPQTYMNNSGFAVEALRHYYKLDLADVLVIYDDMDLPPGVLRLRRAGRAGGHNGMQSIIEQCGSEQICRLKIGIGHGFSLSGAGHVLSRFAEEEMPLMAAAFARASQAALCWAEYGITKAMNEFNGADSAL